MSTQINVKIVSLYSWRLKVAIYSRLSDSGENFIQYRSADIERCLAELCSCSSYDKVSGRHAAERIGDCVTALDRLAYNGDDVVDCNGQYVSCTSKGRV